MNVAALWMNYALIGVRAEVIALRLRQILRQVRRAIAVEISQARAHGRYGDAHPYSRLHGQPPVRLRRFNPVVELVVKQQVWQIGTAVIRIHNGIQKACTDYTPALPDSRHLAQINLPVVRRRAFADQSHALRVRANLRGIERVVYGLNELLLVAARRLRARAANSASANGALGLPGR